MYVLDEPSIGLHQRDNDRLIATLQRLRDLGNSVIVVEHDADMMRCADHILDLGPGAGSHGGRIMAQGTVAQIMASPDSPTGQYLSGQRRIAVPARRTPWLPLREADAPTASAKNAFGQPLHAPPPAQHPGLQCLRVVGGQWAQPAARCRGLSDWPHHLRDGRVRLGQIHPGRTTPCTPRPPAACTAPPPSRSRTRRSWAWS